MLHRFVSGLGFFCFVLGGVFCFIFVHSSVPSLWHGEMGVLKEITGYVGIASMNL